MSLTAIAGYVRSRQAIQGLALMLLLDEFDSHQPFVDACRRAQAEVARTAREPQWNYAWRAREPIRQLARRFNLDRIPEISEFDFEELERAVLRVGEDVGSQVCGPFRPLTIGRGFAVPENPVLHWDGRDFVWDPLRLSLAQFRDETMAALGHPPTARPPAALRDELQKLPLEAEQLGWCLDDFPHALLLHVGWLFLRLCPQPDRPLSAKTIAARQRQHYVDERTVRDATKKIAATLGFALPELPRGRPKKGAPST